jgi:hypothetical protein
MDGGIFLDGLLSQIVNSLFSLMYQTLLDVDIIPHNSHLWKIRIPLKIKVFLWLLCREAILTKDNLVKRN